MGVANYSSTPASNTAISGINIGPNCPPGNIDNFARQIMADIADWYAAGGGGGGSGQPLDATLTALAALTTAADQMPYTTGADAFAMTAATAFGRSLLAASSASSACSSPDWRAPR